MRYIGTLSTKEVKEMERIFFQLKKKDKKDEIHKEMQYLLLLFFFFRRS